MQTGIFQEDRIGQDARYIFAMKMSMNKAKGKVDYVAEANACYDAAEALHKVGVLRGHLELKSFL